MADVYRSLTLGAPVQRVVSGLVLFSIGDYGQVHALPPPAPYRDIPLVWGRPPPEGLPLALAVLADALGETETADDSWQKTTAWRLHKAFATDVIHAQGAAAPLALDWHDVQTWIDEQTIGQPGPLISCVQRARGFEQLLRAAVSDPTARPRHVNPVMWDHWNIEILASLCVVAGNPPSDALGRFVDHLLDLKFKLYCLLEVDVPAYAAAIRGWGLQADNVSATPQGFVARLSEEVTLLVKSRAVWESVMDAVYWYATGRATRTVNVTDNQGVRFKSKTARFFPWVQEEKAWAALATFKPLVDALDQLRTPEVHHLSRVRADFTKLQLQPIDPCVDLLNGVLRYVFDHLVGVIALRREPSYDASAGSGMTL